MAIRLYHLAHELKMGGSQLLTVLRERGMEMQSVMTVLDDAQREQARQVATGEMEIRRPEVGKLDEIKLPPPVVPAPPPGPRRPGPAPSRTPTGPARRTPTQRGQPSQPQQQRRGIRIFRQKEARERKTADKQRAEEIFRDRTIPITVPIALKDFSQQIGVKTNQLLLHLMKQGIRVNPNTSLDEETVLVLADAFSRTVEIQTAKTVEDELEELLTTGAPTEGAEEEAEVDTERRPPVVAVLGHVDHGKTSLLDHIRHARVAAGEAGGITQHIGAYSVELADGRLLTFLDTPGHEAFTAMRARGARLTDIVILIVAADDGVMPQTEEALNHAKAAGVPIVVAVNKCDRPEAQPEKVRQQLSSHGLVPEEWGGETAMIDVSAVTGQGIDKLLERIALEAELLDLSSHPEKPADGYVVEASKQAGKGVVATLLVKDGTLKRGDMLLCGACQGRVKSMTDDRGQQAKEAPSSMPVEVTGLDDVPEAGQRFQVVRDKELVKRVATERSHRLREKELAAKAHAGFEKLMDRLTQDRRELLIVLKADVKGSIEAIRAKLESLSSEEVTVKILHTGVGSITESDVLLAQASAAFVVGFTVIPDAKARAAAEESGVDVRTYDIIYELLDDVKARVQGLMPTETEEIVIGHAEIRKIFLYKKTKIGGCMITDGVARKTAKVRLVRDGRVILKDADLESLRRFKDDVKEVREGFDCGLKLVGYDDIKEGDTLEFYELEEKQKQIGS